MPCRGGRDDRILVVERILRIGDTLVARPALAALRARFPEARVAVVCQRELAALCRADRLLDIVVAVEPTRSGLMEAARAARAFGAARAYIFATDRWSPFVAWFAGAREVVGYNYAGRGSALTARRKPPGRVNTPGFLYPPGAPAVHAAEIRLRLLEPGAAAPSSYPPLEPGEEARAQAERFLARATTPTGPAPWSSASTGGSGLREARTGWLRRPRTQRSNSLTWTRSAESWPSGKRRGAHDRERPKRGMRRQDAGPPQ